MRTPKRKAQQKGNNARKKSQKKQQTRKKNTIKKKNVKKTSAKKLGGVQGPLILEDTIVDAATAPVGAPNAGSAWKVGDAVNCKFTDNKYYAAYVTAVHDDGTYDVFYPEDKEKLRRVSPTKLKKPITSAKGKAAKPLEKYLNKPFFDEGDGDFEGGEFIVHALLEGPSFACLRVGETDTNKSVEFDIAWVIKQVRKYEEE